MLRKFLLKNPLGATWNSASLQLQRIEMGCLRLKMWWEGDRAGLGTVRLLPSDLPPSPPPGVSPPTQRTGPNVGTACFLTGARSSPAAGKGMVEAAHFCYLVARVPFGHYTVKTDHLALLGSSHRYAICRGTGAGKGSFVF